MAQACELNSSLSDNAVLVELRTKFQLDIVVVTRGAEGAVLISEEGVFEQPGVPTTVVDT